MPGSETLQPTFARSFAILLSPDDVAKLWPVSSANIRNEIKIVVCVLVYLMCVRVSVD